MLCCATAEVAGGTKGGSRTVASRVTGGGGNWQLPKTNYQLETAAALQRQRSRMSYWPCWRFYCHGAAIKYGSSLPNSSNILRSL
ncbi:hypothetical protein M5D96_005583 [Drosophila gunungcola]|uniref:Uncharacterized protein n=1 Tax=Drosophila gunungcola TaxID=103775 RepID=A0A9P9YQR1_9MUSC|nr:hypothetical protein M5D96_005583 [Drosophila gunungcola]